MRHTLLTLFLALHPMAAAAPSEVDCFALSHSLPDGGCCVVAGHGTVMNEVRRWNKLLPVAQAGIPSSVPANRVTRALNTPAAASLPADWYDDKYKAFWAADALISADQVRKLWYAALENLDVPISWFCDEAGDNLVIVSGNAANYFAYDMYLYQWQEEKKSFVRRGNYYFGSKYFILVPSRVEFLPEGMRICAVSAREGRVQEFHHLYRYDEGNAAVSFPERRMNAQ